MVCELCGQLCKGPRGLAIHLGRTHYETPEARFWAKVDKRGPDECWEWKAHRQKLLGYGQFGMDRGGPRWDTVLAHRIAWELSNGPIPEDLIVCHSCDNPPCCNPGHLFLGTYRDNIQDAMSKGRMREIPRFSRARGEQVKTSRLSASDVLLIRQMYETSGVSQEKLAARFGVGQTTISRVVLRKVWTHI